MQIWLIILVNCPAPAGPISPTISAKDSMTGFALSNRILLAADHDR